MKSILCLLLIAFSFTLLSCGAPKRIEEPTEVMLNQEQRIPTRLRAMRQANRETPQSEEHLKALMKIAGYDQHPADLRFPAIDHLVKERPDLAREFFGRMVADINHWPTYEKLSKIALDNQWDNFLPAYVDRLTISLPKYKHEDRPEHEAIKELSGGKDALAIAWEVFSGDMPATVIQSAKAWQYLHQHLEEAELIQGLEAIQKRQARPKLTVHDIYKAYQDFGFLPQDATEITWLTLIKAGGSSSHYAKAMRVISTLTNEQKQGIELRHFPLLIYARGVKHPYLKASRDELVKVLSQRLIRRDRFERDKAHQYTDEKSERIEDHRDKMTWADALTLLMLDNALQLEEVQRQLFQHGDEDIKDKETELGGLIVLNKNNTISVIPYAPEAKHHDRQYDPSKKMIVDGYYSFTTYHFHAQNYENEKLSGPGQFDMRFVKVHHLNAIVLTFINENTLNVDWFADNGMMIDLGTIKRK